MNIGTAINVETMIPFGSNPPKAANGNATNTVPSSSLLMENLVVGIELHRLTNVYDDRVRGEIVASPARRDRALRSIILFAFILVMCIRNTPQPGGSRFGLMLVFARRQYR